MACNGWHKILYDQVFVNHICLDKHLGYIIYIFSRARTHACQRTFLAKAPINCACLHPNQVNDTVHVKNCLYPVTLLQDVWIYTVLNGNIRYGVDISVNYVTIRKGAINSCTLYLMLPDYRKTVTAGKAR